LKGQSPDSQQVFNGESSIRERYLNNLKESSLSKSGIASENAYMMNNSATNISMDRNSQLKVTNDRLAKLEKMYEELS